MRKMMLALGAAAMTLPALTAPSVADAQSRYRDREYREYRDDRGRLRCRKRGGTTGAIVGGVGGALLGRAIDTRGDRAVGTIGGAAAGALAGRAIERNGKRRCV